MCMFSLDLLNDPAGYWELGNMWEVKGWRAQEEGEATSFSGCWMLSHGACWTLASHVWAVFWLLDEKRPLKSCIDFCDVVYEKPQPVIMICTAQLSMVGNSHQFASEDYRVNVALTEFWRMPSCCVRMQKTTAQIVTCYLQAKPCVLRWTTAFSKEIFAVATVFVYMCVSHSCLGSTFQNCK